MHIGISGSPDKYTGYSFFSILFRSTPTSGTILTSMDIYIHASIYKHMHTYLHAYMYSNMHIFMHTTALCLTCNG